MTIYTVIGDPHAKPDNLDKINTLFDMVEDLGNPTIWLGDLLDTKEVVRAKCLNTYIQRFQQSKLNHIVIVGNHDWFNLDCKDHSLQALKTLGNVIIIDVPKIIDALVFIPYIHDKITFKALLTKTNPKSSIFCHADISGFDYGNGLISKEGLEAGDFSGFKSVISGHYHKYQKVGNITYLGTPFSHSYGEANQQKYIGLFDTDTRKLELIETPFPHHISYTWNLPNGPCFAYHEGDYHRVILKGTQEEINKVLRIPEIKYIEQPTNQVTETIISEIDTPQVQFIKWAADIKGYSEEVIAEGLEILNDV